MSDRFGKLTGRITATAIDANDTTGNTVYVGATGGGVWKSINAAGPLASVSFTPLTDTLPVFAPSAGTNVIPSLSIGAIAVQPLANPVVLAGTGDPNDASDSLYGQGILRSNDGGLTWTLAQMSDNGANGRTSFAGLSVAALAWSTRSPLLSVAALSRSAEGTAVGATNSTSAPGLFYTTDAGLTWKRATVYDGSSVVQQPAQSAGSAAAATSVVWNAIRQRFYAVLRSHGVYESADGVTWQRLASQPGTGITPVACPATAASASCPLYRGVLAVQPATGDLYALSVDSANGDNGLWQDLCSFNGTSCATTSPVFSHRLDAGAMDSSGVLAQGTYNLVLAAAATSANTLLLAGGTDLYRCVITAGTNSCALRNTTNASNSCATPAGVAPAQHSLALMSQTSGAPLIFIGNDSGLWRSLDGIAQSGAVCSANNAQHFDNLNGALGSLTEVTGFAQHPTDPDILLAGLGGNGSAATAAASATWVARSAWPQVAAGYGGSPLLDAATPSNWYVTTDVGVNLKQCTRGTSCSAADFNGAPTIGSALVGGDAALTNAPSLLDLAQPSNVIVGTCRVWRGPANGVGWSAANAIGAPFGAAPVPCSASAPLVRSLAAGGPATSSNAAQNSGSTVLYAGLAGGVSAVAGHVFMTAAGATANSSTVWTDVALNPVTNDSSNKGQFNPLGFDISALTVDTHDATGATVYATVLGFGSSTVSSPLVYRSTDFGAHWLNISANLPGAPANALVVDPNDANTIYIALDSGVYVTTQIATCATANCWGVLGSALPNAPVVAMAAAAGMPTGDGRLGMLRAGTYGRGLWSMPLLSAITVQQPALVLSPTGLTFASQAIATQSAAQTIVVTSNGAAPLTIKSVAFNGDFVETDTCAGQTLPPGSSCAVQVRFAPTAIGTRNGLLTVYANVAGGQATAALTGTGVAAASLVLTPSLLTFPATVVNQTSAPQNIVVSNTGGATVALQAPSVSGDFHITANSCTTSLAPNTSCSLSVVFTPSASGSRAGTLALVSDAGTLSASLVGAGSAPATNTLSSTSLSFSSTQIGSTSSTQQITITNAGDVPLLLVSAAVVAGPFIAINTCGTSVPARSSCAIGVAFAPTLTGTATGTLAISDQFGVQSVSLVGIGVAPPGVSLTPVAGLTFVNTGVGLTSSVQTLTLTNNGGLALTITSIVASGDFHLASTTCSTTLAPATACAAILVFAPTAGGVRTGAITFTDNAPSGTQSAALSGTATDFTLTPTSPAVVAIASGSSASYVLRLDAPVGVSTVAALSCTGAPAHATCSVSPGNVALGNGVSVTATVQTGLAKAQTAPAPFAQRPAWICLALLLSFASRGARKRRWLSLPTVALAASLLFMSGCGVAREIPAANSEAAPTPTPEGSYPITITAVSAGVTHSVNVTLVVQ